MWYGYTGKGMRQMTDLEKTCKPIKRHFTCDNRIYYTCSYCGAILSKKQKVCDGCDREVMWK